MSQSKKVLESDSMDVMGVSLLFRREYQKVHGLSDINQTPPFEAKVRFSKKGGHYLRVETYVGVTPVTLFQRLAHGAGLDMGYMNAILELTSGLRTLARDPALDFVRAARGHQQLRSVA